MRDGLGGVHEQVVVGALAQGEGAAGVEILPLSDETKGRTPCACTSTPDMAQAFGQPAVAADQPLGSVEGSRASTRDAQRHCKIVSFPKS